MNKISVTGLSVDLRELRTPKNQGDVKLVLRYGVKQSLRSGLNISLPSGYVHSGRLVSAHVCIGLYPECVCVLSHPAFDTHGTRSSVLVNSLANLHTVCCHRSVALPSVTNSGTGKLGTELIQTPPRTTWTAFSLSHVLSTLLI